MLSEVKDRYSPIHWSPFTYFFLAIWVLYAVPQNIPPSVGPGSTGRPTYSYNTLEKLTSQQPIHPLRYEDVLYRVGFPLAYIQPELNGATAIPIIAPVAAGSPPPAPVARGPAWVNWLNLPANLIVILVTMICLVFVAQQSLKRFNLRTMLVSFVLVACFFSLLRFAQAFGFAEAYLTLVFLSPIGIGLYFKLVGVPEFEWYPWAGLSESSQPKTIDHFTTAEDAFAAVTLLDRGGEWADAINLINAVATRWPEHREYAANCVATIEQKQA